MTSPVGTRRRRRGNDETPNGADTVTLDSPEFIKKLLHELRVNTEAAGNAEGQAQRAFTDAAQYDKKAAERGAQEQAALVEVRRAQDALQRVQAERKEAAEYAERAREYGKAQAEECKSFTGQAKAARIVLDQFHIPIPEDAQQGPPALPSPAPAPPTVPVSIVPDPAEAARMDKSFAVIDAAHEDLPADQRNEGDL